MSQKTTHALAGRVSAEGVAADNEAVKRARYVHLVNADTQELVPIIFDSFGHSGPPAPQACDASLGTMLNDLAALSGKKNITKNIKEMLRWLYMSVSFALYSYLFT